MTLLLSLPTWAQSGFGDNQGIEQRNTMEQERREAEAERLGEDSSDSNIKNNADQSQSQNSAAGVIGMVTGAALTVSGYNMIKAGQRCPPTSPCPWLITMGYATVAQGALSFMQGGHNNKTGAYAGMTSAAVDAYGYDSFDNNLDLGPYGYNKDSQNLKEYKAGISALKTLEEKGYKVGKDGSITFPDGSTLAGGFSSAALGTKLGLSKDDIKKLDANTKKTVASSLKKAGKMGFMASSRRGSSRPSKGYDIDAELDSLLGRGKKTQKKNQRKVANVAGMYRMHKGEKIGVSGDNIFKMISRRYDLKKKQKAFIE